MRILFTFLFLFSPSLVFSAEPDKKLHESCLYPTVAIGCVNPVGQPYDSGTGVIVRSERHPVGIKNKPIYCNVVVTCGHILTGIQPEVKVPKYENWSDFKGYESYQAKLIAVSTDRDLAILVFASTEKMPTAEWGFDVKKYIGTDVFRIGCSRGMEPRLDKGQVTSIKDIEPATAGKIRVNIFTVPGDSGGPTYCEYKLIGLAQTIKVLNSFGQGIPAFNISNIVPIEEFKKWNEEELNNTLDYIYNNKSKMPVLPFKMLELGRYETQEIIPKGYWSN
jgi:hypothetical protein